MLLEAWSGLENRDQWHLVLTGPDEHGYRAELEQQVKMLKIGDSVRFAGIASSDEKWQALANAKALVLPSHAENFGLSVAEALSVRTPVIATEGTPWQCLNEHRCGWWVKRTVSQLQRAMEAAINLRAAEREEMGSNGSRLVRERFSWTEIAREFSSVYQWIMGIGPKPVSVID